MPLINEHGHAINMPRPHENALREMLDNPLHLPASIEETYWKLKKLLDKRSRAMSEEAIALLILMHDLKLEASQPGGTSFELAAAESLQYGDPLRFTRSPNPKAPKNVKGTYQGMEDGKVLIRVEIEGGGHQIQKVQPRFVDIDEEAAELVEA